MTKDKLRKVLNLLEVNQSQLGRAFEIPDRQVRRWIAGDRDIPDDVAMHLEVMADEKSLEDCFAEIKKRHAKLRDRLNAEREAAAARAA
jgi:plasmid maintenance system antidote protein VapI